MALDTFLDVHLYYYNMPTKDLLFKVNFKYTGLSYSHNPHLCKCTLTKKYSTGKTLDTTNCGNLVCLEVRITSWGISTKNLMQGARGILVAVINTYIFEEPLAQNAHAENSEYFINHRTSSFLHISTKKKIKPLSEKPQFLTMVLMKTVLQGYEAMSTGTCSPRSWRSKTT